MKQWKKWNLILLEIWTLVSRANKYIDETAPWVLAKEEEKRNELESVMIHLAEKLTNWQSYCNQS